MAVALPDRLALRVPLDPPVQQGLQVLPVLMALRVPQALLVLQVLQARMEQQALQVLMARLDPPVSV